LLEIGFRRITELAGRHVDSAAAAAVVVAGVEEACRSGETTWALN